MKKVVLLAAAALLASTMSYSQATPKATARQVRQQERIHQGVKSGEVTKKEAVRLEAQQAKIARDKKVAKSDGVVTPAERAKIQHEQNRASRTIRRQKHDGQKR